jgi:hypothetical protein
MWPGNFFLFGSRAQKFAHYISKNIASVDLSFGAASRFIHDITIVIGIAELSLKLPAQITNRDFKLKRGSV